MQIRPRSRRWRAPPPALPSARPRTADAAHRASRGLSSPRAVVEDQLYFLEMIVGQGDRPPANRVTWTMSHLVIALTAPRPVHRGAVAPGTSRRESCRGCLGIVDELSNVLHRRASTRPAFGEAMILATRRVVRRISAASCTSRSRSRCWGRRTASCTACASLSAAAAAIFAAGAGTVLDPLIAGRNYPTATGLIWRATISTGTLRETDQSIFIHRAVGIKSAAADGSSPAARACQTRLNANQQCFTQNPSLSVPSIFLFTLAHMLFIKYRACLNLAAVIRT